MLIRSRGRSTLPALSAAVTALAAVAAPMIGAVPAAAASAAPMAPRSAPDGGHGSAVVAHDPRPFFVEDFENGLDKTPVMLDAYTGAAGETYTADPAWIDAAQCNGIITSAASADMPGCRSNDPLRELGRVLGMIAGQDPTNNHVISAWTASKALPVDGVQIESKDPFSLGASGRFVSFGVNAAAGACKGYAHPLLDFRLVDGNEDRPVSERPIDPCDDERSKDYDIDGNAYRGGEFVSSGGVLFQGEQLRWRLVNKQTASEGNDGAIDQVTIVDSTPTLVSSFGGTPVIGDPTRMTMRVVNTTERGGKPGWAFSERLPDGLTVADDAKTETTCANVDADIAAGAASVSVRGDLAIDSADCEVSFDVVAASPGTYATSSSDVSGVSGLDVDVDASVTFEPEHNVLAASERADLSGGNGDAVADLDETVTFVTTVENQGNVVVRDLAVEGQRGTGACTVRELQPGARTECAEPAHTVTQADLDAGTVTDSVAVHASSRLGQDVSASAAASVATTVGQPAAVLTVTPEVDGRPGVGDEVGLEAVVTNTGNVSIADLTVVVADRPEFAAACPDGPLAPGASIACAVEGTHTVTQDDVDAGSLGFSAVLHGTGASGDTVTANASATQETVAQAPAVGSTLTSSVEPTGDRPAAGDPITSTLVVGNTGNVTLSDLEATVADHAGHAVDCPDGPLAPGAEVECTVEDGTIRQADLDRGTVDVTADVTAHGPKGQDVAASDTATVTVDQHRGLAAVAHAALADDGSAPHAGDRVALDVLVRNSGNVTLRDVVAEVDGRSPATDCPEDALAPGAEVTCTLADHVLTQGDVDAGAVEYTVEVRATGPGGDASTTDSASVTLARVPALTASATSVLDATEHEVPLAGDTATVGMTVRNTGNVTVTGVRAAVVDRAGLEMDCGDDVLAPGARTTCAGASYTLTQADVDAGSVRFDTTVAATGTNRERAEAAASTTLTVVRAPAITSRATAALVDGAHTAPVAGDEAEVEVLVHNAGNVTLHGLTAAVEGREGLVVTCADDTLAPGADATCTASRYRLTQEDVDGGRVDFAVTAAATGADGRRVTASAGAGVDVDRAPAVDAEVLAHLAGSESAVPRAGDRVTVGVRVTNTGNVTIASVTGEVVELPDLAVDCGAVPVAPGASVECTVPEYVLTQSDVERGQVTVAAVVDAAGPDELAADARDEVRVGLTAASALDLTGTAVVEDSAGRPVAPPADRVLRPGDQVSIRYTVVNTGNLTAEGLAPHDGSVAMDLEHTVLEPGARTAATSAPHTVTDAEAAAGEVVLVGQVTGHVARADGDSVVESDATTGQTGGPTTIIRTGPATAGPASAGADEAPQGAAVSSEQLRTVLRAASVPSVPTEPEAEPVPSELAFTGSTVLRVALPAAAVLLLGGVILLVRAQRRCDGADASHPAED